MRPASARDIGASIAEVPRLTEILADVASVRGGGFGVDGLLREEGGLRISARACRAWGPAWRLAVSLLAGALLDVTAEEVSLVTFRFFIPSDRALARPTP